MKSRICILLLIFLLPPVFGIVSVPADPAVPSGVILPIDDAMHHRTGANRQVSAEVGHPNGQGTSD